MGTFNEAGDFYNSIKKDKLMKWIFRILFAVLALAVILSIIFYIIDRNNNRHAKLLWGLSEFNPKEDVLVKPIVNDSTKIKDSGLITFKKQEVSLPITNKLPIGKDSRIIITPKSKDAPAKVKSTVNGDNNKTVIGNNSGIVGDVTINNGSRQRHITQEYAQMIIKRLEDTLRANKLNKDVIIEFGCTMGSDESIAFTNEVGNFLYNNGYKNISEKLGVTMGNNYLRILYVDHRIFIDVGIIPPQ